MSVAAPKMAEELNWSEYQKGMVLSAFYWGYTVGQVPSNIISRKYGPKLVYAVSIIIPSILTMLVPIAAKKSFEMALLIRAMIGLFESAAFPAVFHFFSNWVPLEEKTVLIPTTYSGMYLGEVIGFSLSGLVVDSVVMSNGIDYGGWPAVFYIFGFLGFIWLPFWIKYAYDTPLDHPYISEEELALISKGRKVSFDAIESMNINRISIPTTKLEIGTVVHADATKPLLDDSNRNKNDDTARVDSNNINVVPWKAFFTNKVSLTLLFNSFVFGFTNFLLLSEMPSYLKDVLGFSLSSSGMLSVIPYASLFIFTLSFGNYYNYLNSVRGWSNLRIRYISQFVASILGSLFLLICGFLDDRYIAFACLVVAQALQGSAQSGIGCAYLEISPTFSSSLNTVGNTLSSIAGVAGPLVVSALVSNYDSLWGWRSVFFLTTFLNIISFTIWLMFYTANIVYDVNTPVLKSL